MCTNSELTLKGAILQCADSITTTLKEAINENPTLAASVPSIVTAIEDAIGSAETITLCAQHQKAIVDEYEKYIANAILNY